ncbi:MAG: hypothetical protein J6C13_01785 [Clostridia bacterium]|nr:hypothetical protein [Clostridia bacterium]
MQQFELKLDEQQLKCIKYCYEQQGKSFDYETQNNSIIFTQNPDIQMDNIINVLAEFYFSLQDKTSKLSKVVNETIEKIFSSANEYVDNIDVDDYFSFIDE